MKTSHLIWITNDWGSIENHVNFERQEGVYFRKEFTLSKTPKKAELIISTNGIANIFINGEDLSKEYLAPGIAEYTNCLSFRRYDATDYLTDKNAICVVAGDGWYCGEFMQRERASFVFGLKIALTLSILYDDNSQEIITSDDTWQTFRGALGLNDVYHGEEFDARKPHAEYSIYGKNFVGERAILTTVLQENLIEYDLPPVKKTGEIIPVCVGKSRNGGLLYDFKQNFSGVLEISVKGEAGAKIVMRHAEGFTLDGEDIYTKNLRVARQTDEYTLCGRGEERYIPTFTYHGFSVAEIKIEGNAELLSVKGIVLHTDLEKLGDFYSDNDLVNRIYSCALWGAKSNFVCIPTDCPQRNERFGWLADTQVFAGTAVNMFDVEKFYDYYMTLVDKATGSDGNVPVFVPRIPPIGAKEAVFGWSDAVIIIPYVVYRYYGNKEIIQKYIPLMKRYMDFCKRRRPEPIQNAMQYGDWLNAGQDTARELIATAYYAQSAKLFAYLLDEVGDEDSKYYLELFESIRTAYRKEFLDEDVKRLKKEYESQTAYALSLCFGLISSDEAREGIYESFEEFDFHVMSGFMGASYVLPALCDCGNVDLAYKLLCNDTYPSWGHCIKHGATTFWEHWDAYDKNKGFKEHSDPIMTSLNHYCFGSVAEWFYTCVLGIKPLLPGFKKVQIKPYIDKSGMVTKAKGYHITPYGKISVEWTVSGDVARISVAKPVEIDAEFKMDRVISIDQDGKRVDSLLGDWQRAELLVKIK